MEISNSPKTRDKARAKPGVVRGLESSHGLKQPSLVKPLVAMIHLPPLPGAGNYDGTSVRMIAQRAVAEAQLLSEAGFDALLIQNTHDRPSTIYVPPETLTAMTAVGEAGGGAGAPPPRINVHKNDGPGPGGRAPPVGGGFLR